MADSTNNKNESSNSPVLIFEDGKYRYYDKDRDIIEDVDQDGVTVREHLWRRPMLIFEDGYVHYYGSGGKLIGSYPAQSGQPGEKDPSIPWKGPIPPGTYLLDPSKIEDVRPRDRAAWGNYRAALLPDGTDTYGRTGFYLHGGTHIGTGGCINIGNRDKELLPKLMMHMEPILVIVRQ